MGIQGNTAATHEHDFLSLYAAAAKDSPLQLHHADSKPPHQPPPASQGQGFLLKTHDFLHPLEKPAEETSSSSGREQQPQRPVVKQHAALPLPLPGGVGTFSIRPAVVKAEPPLVLWGQPASQPGGRDFQSLETGREKEEAPW